MSFFRALGAIIDYNIRYLVFVISVFLAIGEINIILDAGFSFVAVFLLPVLFGLFKISEFAVLFAGLTPVNYYYKEIEELSSENDMANNKKGFSKGSRLTDIERNILLKEARAKGLLQ